MNQNGTYLGRTSVGIILDVTGRLGWDQLKYHFPGTQN